MIKQCESKHLSVFLLGAILAILCAVQAAHAGSAALPSLVGQWKIKQMAGVSYENILDLNATPEFASGAPGDFTLVVTDQKLNAFAGYVTSGTETLLLTGAIAADNTVVFQMAGGTGHNSRFVFNGKYSVSGRKKLIKGTYSSYEEWVASVPFMENGYLELEKK